MDVSNGHPNSSAPDNSLVEGDLNAPQRTHNGLRFSGIFDFAWAGEFLLFALVVSAVSGAALLICLALKHPSPVRIISASLFTVVVAVTLSLLLAGWTRGHGKMMRIGVSYEVILLLQCSVGDCVFLRCLHLSSFPHFLVFVARVIFATIFS
ncbi:hypothetical protein EUGRSUZ_L00015 [Eucalyptus grandis]|uniref:Uncharacterized protein n=2 Tax=Eucalyptus grandis TaxID=71139 RepID=A0ACC3LZV4_EUCGR|nr:hypothetical protein EUGRSUZ_L00015 [Eucalyptus grandis]